MKIIEFLQQLIRCKSITPDDQGAIDLISKTLEKYNFHTNILYFDGNNSYKVKNLYAKYGNGSPHLCFAGHSDVVPASENNWKFMPFSGEIHNNIIYGRGVVDMKGAIAAMVQAAISFTENYNFKGSISFIITGDEEAEAVNGTHRVLEFLSDMGESIDACILGEPTSTKVFGDTIKIGRRGSITFNLSIKGIQGHVAYPHYADNPINHLIAITHKLNNLQLDLGNEIFDPSHLEITTIDVNNPISNMIPTIANCTFNIRFNTLHTIESLVNLVASICDSVAFNKYTLNYSVASQAFYNKYPELTDHLQNAIKKVINKEAILSTSGGSSDARFIKNYCPVIEFGLLNNTAHKTDENADIEDINKLSKIYYELLLSFYKDFY